MSAWTAQIRRDTDRWQAVVWRVVQRGCDHAEMAEALACARRMAETEDP